GWVAREPSQAGPVFWDHWENADILSVAATPFQALYKLNGSHTLKFTDRFGGISTLSMDPPGVPLAGFTPIDPIDSLCAILPGLVAITTEGVFATTTALPAPIFWIKLGMGPAGACGVRAAVSRGTPAILTFYVQAALPPSTIGFCDGRTGGSLWKYTGTDT